MKVHKYEKWFFDDWEYSKKRLYIPEKGVIEYHKNSKDIFFFDDEEDMKDAEKITARRSPEEYFGEIELPDDEVLQLVALGKTLNNAKTEFEKVAKSLIDKLEG